MEALACKQELNKRKIKNRASYSCFIYNCKATYYLLKVAVRNKGIICS